MSWVRKSTFIKHAGFLLLILVLFIGSNLRSCHDGAEDSAKTMTLEYGDASRRSSIITEHSSIDLGRAFSISAVLEDGTADDRGKSVSFYEEFLDNGSRELVSSSPITYDSGRNIYYATIRWRSPHEGPGEYKIIAQFENDDYSDAVVKVCVNDDGCYEDDPVCEITEIVEHPDPVGEYQAHHQIQLECTVRIQNYESRNILMELYVRPSSQSTYPASFENQIGWDFFPEFDHKQVISWVPQNAGTYYYKLKLKDDQNNELFSSGEYRVTIESAGELDSQNVRLSQYALEYHTVDYNWVDRTAVSVTFDEIGMPQCETYSADLTPRFWSSGVGYSYGSLCNDFPLMWKLKLEDSGGQGITRWDYYDPYKPSFDVADYCESGTFVGDRIFDKYVGTACQGIPRYALQRAGYENILALIRQQGYNWSGSCAALYQYCLPGPDQIGELVTIDNVQVGDLFFEERIGGPGIEHVGVVTDVESNEEEGIYVVHALGFYRFFDHQTQRQNVLDIRNGLIENVAANYQFSYGRINPGY